MRRALLFGIYIRTPDFWKLRLKYTWPLLCMDMHVSHGQTSLQEDSIQIAFRASTATTAGRLAWTSYESFVLNKGRIGDRLPQQDSPSAISNDFGPHLRRPRDLINIPSHTKTARYGATEHSAAARIL